MALTSELSIRFLRPAQGERMICRATLEAVSRRSVVGTAHVWCEGQPDKTTAAAQGTYAIPLPMNADERPRFHLAFPVDDLVAARHFYGEVLGCPEGRSADHWVDFDLYGHQIVAHLVERRSERPTTRSTATTCPFRISACCCARRSGSSWPIGCLPPASSS